MYGDLNERYQVDNLIMETLIKHNLVEIYQYIRWDWIGGMTFAIGKARFRPSNTPVVRHHFEIRLSAPLWPRADFAERKHTIVHELCHLIAMYQAWLCKRHIDPHGCEWADCMYKSGEVPSRTHNVDRTGLVRKMKRIHAFCSAGCRPMEITPIIARKIRSGKQYVCRLCRHTVKLPPDYIP